MPLPPGFELEQAIKPPPGFELESPVQELDNTGAEPPLQQIPWYRVPMELGGEAVAGLANLIAPKKQQFTISPGQKTIQQENVPRFQAGQPMINMPETTREAMGGPDEGRGLVRGAVTPEAVLGMTPIGRAAFGMEGAAGLAQTLGTLSVPQVPLQEKQQAAANLPIQAGMLLAPAYDLKSPVKEPLGQTFLGMPEARRTDVQTLGDVIDDLRESLEQRPGQVTPGATPAGPSEPATTVAPGEVSAVGSRIQTPPVPVELVPEGFELEGTQPALREPAAQDQPAAPKTTGEPLGANAGLPTAAPGGIGTAPAAPIVKQDLSALRPAVRLIDGKVVVGEKGQVHDDIIKTLPDSSQIDRRGFVDTSTENWDWVDREEPGLPDSGQPVPGLHAGGEGGLAEHQGIESEVRPNETQKEKGTQEGILKGGEVSDSTSAGRVSSDQSSNAQELRNVQVQGGGTETAPSDQAVPKASLMSAEAAKLRHDLLPLLDEQTRKDIGNYYQSTGDLQGAMAKADAAWREQVKGPRKMFEGGGTKPTGVSQRHIQNLGLRHGESATEALTKLVSKANVYGANKAALATYLNKVWGHVLQGVRVFHDAHPEAKESPSYDPVGHNVHLNPEGFDKNVDYSDLNIVDALLHESVHAATVWALHTRKGAKLREGLEELRKFSQQFYAERLAGEAPDRRMAYHFGSVDEFVTGLFESPAFRDHLNAITKSGETVLNKAWKWVKDLLGINPGSAAEVAFDELTKLGERVNMADINEVRKQYDMDPLNMIPPIRNVATLHELTLGEKFKDAFAKFRGITLPLHSTASEKVGNALASCAVASKAAGPIGKAMATDVLGKNWNQVNFRRLLGAVMMEDRFNAKRDEHTKAGNASLAAAVNHVWNLPGSPITSEALYKKVLARPEIQEALNRHKATVQPELERRHTELGGTLAPVGPDTGTFINLKVLFPDQPNLDSVVYSKQGRLTNPLLRSSALSKEFKGTGRAYEFDYRTMIERAVKLNHERYKLEQYYKAAVDEGLAHYQKGGEDLPQGFDRSKYSDTDVIRQGTGPGMTRVDKFWLRKDLIHEFRNAAATDLPPAPALIRYAGELLTSVQVAGPTDLMAHAVNILADVATSPGGGGFLYDLLRKTTPVGLADSVVRVGWNIFKAYAEHAELDMKGVPETQQRVAKIADIGAGRSAVIHTGALERGLEKVKPGLGKALPQHWSAVALKAIDRGGRLAKDKMFDSLVKDYGIEDNDFNRREFINQLGQYESRLMGPLARTFRETNFSPFVVAGTTFNRNAMRQMLVGTGPHSYRAADPVGWAKLRTLDLLGMASIMFGLPIAANMAITGKPFGRPGTHPGMIDMGGEDDKHGKHKEFDPSQLTLYRRGQRLTGFQSLRESQAEKLGTKETAQRMIGTMVDAWVHPYTGPAVKFGVTAVTGKDTTGYLLSRNPTDMGENVVAALKNSQPQIAAYFKGKEEGKTAGPAMVGAMGQSLGVKTSRAPTLEEKGVLKGTLPERRQAIQQLGKPERSDLAERAAGEKAYWKSWERKDALVAALPKDQQDWLKTNNLKLPAFQPSSTVRGVRIPETKEEQELTQRLVAQETQRVIAAVQNREGLSAAGRQRLLDKMLEMSHRRVRAQVRRQIGAQVPNYELDNTPANQ